MKRLLLIFSLLFLFSCYYDNEEYLYPNSEICETAGVNYQNYIASLMETHCNSCHNTSSPSGNIITDDYQNLLVIAENGQLEGVVNHLPGFSPMPKNSNKLAQCDLDKISAWISAGSPES